MGKLLWHTMMTLDGFIAGPNDDMSWMSGMDAGSAEHIVIEMGGSNPRPDEPFGRFVLEKAWDQIQLLIDKAQPIEHHRFHRLPERDRALSPTTSLEYVDQIYLHRIAVLQSQVTRESGLLDSHKSLC